MATLIPANAFQPQPLSPITPIEEISPEWAWGGSDGRGVRVAIVDSGVDADHPAIAGRVKGYVEVTESRTGEIICHTEPHHDTYGHGTACAGIILGLAPECEIYSVKVLGPALLGSGSAFAAGLRWVVENEMHVCNLSLGTTKRDFFAALHELTDLAYFRNIMVVAAANNVPVPSFPSVYASVFSVAAHDSEHPSIYYYNRRPPVEWSAPGINVHVAWRNGGMIDATGNSFAAPYIAGLIAKIRAKHPDLTAFQMKFVLRALAENIQRAAPDRVLLPAET